MLRRLCGEEHLLLRPKFRVATASIQRVRTDSLPLLTASIEPRSSLTLVRSYHEDLTLNQRTVGMPEFDQLIDMARLLVNLWEAAQRLPDGSERRAALIQISAFQRRVAALITRTL